MFFGNGNRFVSVAVDAHHNRATNAFHLIRIRVDKPLNQLHTRVAQLFEACLAHDGIMNQDRFFEIELKMGKDVFKCQPINLLTKTLLVEKCTAVVVEMTLRSVVDMVKRVKVGHADLDGTSSFHTEFLCS